MGCRGTRLTISLAVLLVAGACGNPGEDVSAVSGAAKEHAPQQPSTKMTFAPDEAGLMLVWYDEQGVPHSVTRVEDVPEQARQQVRVDFLMADSARRPPAGQLFVADLRQAVDGQYVARSVPREDFDRALAARGAPSGVAPAGEGEPGEGADVPVVLYGTSWCGACRQARSFLRKRGVDFRDRDVEKDPGAREELQRKARAAGVSTRGVPVIDVGGTLVTGFDPQRLSALLASSG